MPHVPSLGNVKRKKTLAPRPPPTLKIAGRLAAAAAGTALLGSGNKAAMSRSLQPNLPVHATMTLNNGPRAANNFTKWRGPRLILRPNKVTRNNSRNTRVHLRYR